MLWMDVTDGVLTHEPVFFGAWDESRARSLRSRSRRERFLRGRALLATGLEAVGIDPDDVRLTEGRLGSPVARVAGERVWISLSHSRSHVACAISRGGPVGIDVERIVSLPERVAQRFFTPQEMDWTMTWGDGAARARASLWTIKEAVAKAASERLHPMPHVDVPLASTGRVGNTRWRSLHLDDDLVGTVAWRHHGAN